MHRELTTSDFDTLDWNETPEGRRINADVACGRCGAYQAVDSDPTEDTGRAARLAARLLNSVGWRIDDQNQKLCPDCAQAPG